MNRQINTVSNAEYPILLTPEEAASILGVKVNTLNTWRSTGRYGIPYLRLAGKIKYREQDILAFIQSSLIEHKSIS